MIITVFRLTNEIERDVPQPVLDSFFFSFCLSFVALADERIKNQWERARFWTRRARTQKTAKRQPNNAIKRRKKKQKRIKPLPQTRPDPVGSNRRAAASDAAGRRPALRSGR